VKGERGVFWSDAKGGGEGKGGGWGGVGGTCLFYRGGERSVKRGEEKVFPFPCKRGRGGAVERGDRLPKAFASFVENPEEEKWGDQGGGKVCGGGGGSFVFQTERGGGGRECGRLGGKEIRGTGWFGFDDSTFNQKGKAGGGRKKVGALFAISYPYLFEGEKGKTKGGV